MNFYQKYILPKAIDWACSQSPSRKQREKVVPLAYGEVLEIGVGSGLNLPFYDERKIKRLTAIEPSLEVWNKRNINTETLPFEFEFKQAFAENIPAEDDRFDTVLMTYTLCSIPDFNQALKEIKRVLKPGGQFVFCEHGKAPDRKVERFQNVINPVWKRFGGGCNLNRAIPTIIEQNGFTIDQLESSYIPGPKFASFNYWGVALVKFDK